MMASNKQQIQWIKNLRIFTGSLKAFKESADSSEHEVVMKLPQRKVKLVSDSVRSPKSKYVILQQQNEKNSQNSFYY